MTGHKGESFPFLTAEELPDFLAALESYKGSPLPRLGLQIMMLAGLRTYELRHSKWEWVDFDNRLWEIPAEFMKIGPPAPGTTFRSALFVFAERVALSDRSIREYVPRQMIRQRS